MTPLDGKQAQALAQVSPAIDRHQTLAKAIVLLGGQQVVGLM
jgi:hypothetical protein